MASTPSSIRSDLERCIGCGALFPAADGPTHRYMESSPGCWAAYGEILAREYSDFRFARAHRLTVDAYAVQHPGKPSPQSVKSVAVHLISLHLVLERNVEMGEATQSLQTAARAGHSYEWLEPPPSRGELNVTHVVETKEPDHHVELIWSWARSAWSAWISHHDTIRKWAQPVTKG